MLSFHVHLYSRKMSAVVTTVVALVLHCNALGRPDAADGGAALSSL